MVSNDGAGLLAIVGGPLGVRLVRFDHLGPHNPVEWAIYVSLTAILIGVLIIALRRGRADRR